MSIRSVRTALSVVCVILLCGLPAAAGGLYFGVPLFTLNVSTTITQLPVAVNGSFDALESTAIDLGMTPAEVAEIQAQFAEALTGIEEFARGFPAWVPIPLLGGGIEFRLPLLVIDDIRISGGWLSESLVRMISSTAGFELPQPLVNVDLDVGEYAGNIVADIGFQAWSLSTEAIKRFDVFLLALNLGAGVDLFGGKILPQISYDLPPEMTPGAADALNALHLDALSWSGFAVHGMIGFELGPPFLRFYGDLRWTVPLSQDEEWWGIRLGPLSALLGFVIRF